MEEGVEVVAAVEGLPPPPAVDPVAGCTRCIPPGADAGAGIVRTAMSEFASNRITKGALFSASPALNSGIEIGDRRQQKIKEVVKERIDPAL